MIPYWSNGRAVLWQGHVLDCLAAMEAQSVHCAVTSPPYWGLRDYGLPSLEWPAVSYAPMAGLPPLDIPGCDPGCEHVWGEERRVSMSAHHLDDSITSIRGGGHKKATIESTQGQYCQLCGGWRGCLGLEPTPAMFVGHIVLVARELWRVLRDDGTFWCNMGDSFSSGVGSNLTDCFQSVHKGGAMIVRNAATIGITAHGVDVAQYDNRFPYRKLLSLFGVKRVTIKQRDNDFCQVLHCLASPSYAWVSVPAFSVTRYSTDLEIVLDKGYDISIVIAQGNPDRVSKFGIPVGAVPMVQGDGTLAVKETAEPITESIGDGETIGDTISFDAPLKRFPDIYLVNDSVPFSDGASLAAQSIGHLGIVETSEQHFALSSQKHRVNISTCFVGHNCYFLQDGLFTRYDTVYAQATSLSNGRQAKQEMGIPAMVREALKADGWICRSSIIWAKGVSFCPTYSGSCMPGSQKDRPTSSYEHVFLLAKSKRYFYDHVAVREASVGQTGQAASFARDTKDHVIPNQSVAQHRTDREPTKDNGTRNLRTVWTLPQPVLRLRDDIGTEKRKWVLAQLAARGLV